MPSYPHLTIREVRARPVNVSLVKPLQTSSGVLDTVPLVLIDLLTEEGITGCAYLFCYTPVALKPVAQIVANIETLITGEAVAPLALEQKLQKSFRLLGTPGLLGMALAGLDMAAWDALAKASELPLVRLLGGEARPIPAYASFFLNGVEGASHDAEVALAGGFKALKIKVGYPTVQTDLEAIRAVRRVVGEEVALMVDYNQSLSVPEAISRIRLLDEAGVYWVEEPTLYDDFAGHAHIRSQVKTPLQIGENWWGPHDMSKSIAAGASDFVMPDVMKIGGVTGWLRASALAEVHGLPVSSHLFQEISAHLLAITPTAAWLEQLDLANSILQQPLTFENGCAIIPETAGSGLSWDEAAIARFTK